MSQYSRAVVVERADAAKKIAIEALEDTKKLQRFVAEYDKAATARTLRVAEMFARRFGPAERVIKAGFWGRLHWLLYGAIPAPEKSIDVAAVKTPPTVKPPGPENVLFTGGRPPDESSESASSRG